MKKLLTFLLSFVLILQPVTYAHAATSFEDDAHVFIENLTIDGVDYVFSHNYTSTKRTVTISNNTNDNIDIVTYSVGDDSIYLNNSVLAVVDTSPAPLLRTYSVLADDGWRLLTSDVHNITWRQGTTTAVVAAALAAFLPNLGTAGIIAAMGAGALSVLAASAIGGTLYLECYIFTVPMNLPTYRYVWSFTASTGESYGPYSYTYA